MLTTSARNSANGKSRVSLLSGRLVVASDTTVPNSGFNAPNCSRNWRIGPAISTRGVAESLNLFALGGRCHGHRQRRNRKTNATLIMVAENERDNIKYGR